MTPVDAREREAMIGPRPHDYDEELKRLRAELAEYEEWYPWHFHTDELREEIALVEQKRKERE